MQTHIWCDTMCRAPVMIIFPRFIYVIAHIIPFYDWIITISWIYFVSSLVSIWVVSLFFLNQMDCFTFWLARIMLIWTLMYKFLCDCMLSILYIHRSIYLYIYTYIDKDIYEWSKWNIGSYSYFVFYWV
jgi:hypothetical protein